jgi:hypothetical protein
LKEEDLDVWIDPNVGFERAAEVGFWIIFIEFKVFFGFGF